MFDEFGSAKSTGFYAKLVECYGEDFVDKSFNFLLLGVELGIPLDFLSYPLNYALQKKMFDK